MIEFFTTFSASVAYNSNFVSLIPVMLLSSLSSLTEVSELFDSFSYRSFWRLSEIWRSNLFFSCGKVMLLFLSLISFCFMSLLGGLRVFLGLESFPAAAFDLLSFFLRLRRWISALPFFRRN